MTRLDPPPSPEEEAAAAAMWELWDIAQHAASTWLSEGDAIRDMWRAYARAALSAAQAAGAGR